MWIEEKELEEEMVRIDGGEVGVFGQSYGLSFLSLFFIWVVLTRVLSM